MKLQIEFCSMNKICEIGQFKDEKKKELQTQLYRLGILIIVNTHTIDLKVNWQFG